MTEFFATGSIRIYNSYDVDNIEKVYLHGDGASWIEEGLNWLPNVKVVLDKYHLRKSIFSVTERHPEVQGAIYSSVRHDG